MMAAVASAAVRAEEVEMYTELACEVRKGKGFAMARPPCLGIPVGLVRAEGLALLRCAVAAARPRRCTRCTTS